MSFCLVPGSTGDDGLRGGLGGWGWGRQLQQRVDRGVKARTPPIECAQDISCLASDCGEGHRPRCLRHQEWGSPVPQERGCHVPGDGGVRAPVSVLQQQVVRERTPGPSCPHTPAWGLRGHAGLVINKLPYGAASCTLPRSPRLSLYCGLQGYLAHKKTKPLNPKL